MVVQKRGHLEELDPSDVHLLLVHGVDAHCLQHRVLDFLMLILQ